MKKIKTSICVWLALSAVFMTGCYNDEDLWNIGDFVSVVIPDDAMERIEKILGFQRFERHVG